MKRSRLLPAVALAGVAALHLISIPRSIVEFDEVFFAMAVERYEPLLHHPPPPGNPIFIAAGKVAALFTGAAFPALLATSVVALLAGLAIWTRGFAAMSDFRTAVLATIILFASPAVLASGTMALSDAGALALFGLAAWACARGNPVAIGIACAAAVGWRVQLCIAVVPMFVLGVVLLRDWRARFTATAVFGATCLTWFVPLVVSTGGPASFWNWLSGQAAYYARHDAAISRSGYSPAQIALRFAAHPWGQKWLSIPLLAAAAAGAFALRRNRAMLPLAAGSMVYLAFSIASMDPADAVRYAIPCLPFVALLAAAGLVGAFRRFSLAPAAVLTVLYAAGSYLHASPLLIVRAREVSPPSAAAAWIRTHMPPGTVVGYDMPLRPHADYLLRGFTTMRIDEALARASASNEPLVLYADGELGGAKGVTFRWPDSEAWRKLTRQHYGAVSVIEVPPAERFRVIEGVFAPERRRDGAAWRWIGARGVIELPESGASRVRITLRTPPEYPLPSNRVRVVTAAGATVVNLGRDATATAELPLGAGPNLVSFEPERTFVPADIAGARNRDPRRLSVMLAGVSQTR